jgi:hypothetical protein
VTVEKILYVENYRYDNSSNFRLCLGTLIQSESVYGAIVAKLHLHLFMYNLAEVLCVGGRVQRHRRNVTCLQNVVYNRYSRISCSLYGVISYMCCKSSDFYLSDSSYASCFRSC